MFLPADQFVGWQLDAALTAERCSELLAVLTAHGFEPTGARYPGDYRNNDRLVLDDPALAASLFDVLRARLPSTLVIDGERWLLDGLNTRFRACRYGNGQAFCIHRDGPYAPETDRRSHLTLQLYLDDDPARTGGNTRFYADPRGDTLWASIAPRTGTAIVFDHRAWHDGEAVTHGIKHVVRTDVMYRRFESTTVLPPALATAAADGTTALVRSVAPATMHVVHRHRGYAWHAVVCRDGTIASAGRDGTVRLRAFGGALRAAPAARARPDDAPPTTTTTSTAAFDAAFDLPAGSVARLGEWAVGRAPGDWHTRLASLNDVAFDATLDLGAGSVTRLVEAADGRLWAGTRAGVLFVIDGRHAKPVTPVPDRDELGAILDLAERAGGGVIAATARGELVAFERNGSIAWRVRAHEGWAWSVVADGSGGYVSCGHAGQVVAVDDRGGVRELARLPASLRACAVGDTAIWAGDTRGVLHRLDREGRVVESRAVHRGAITSISLLPDELVATAGEDGLVHVWRDQERVASFTSRDFVTSVTHDRRGRLIWSAYDGAIYRDALPFGCRPAPDDVLARAPAR